MGLGGLIMLTVGPVRAATVTVAAVNFEFQPASRSVRVGDVVRWTFTGDPHTVTSGTPGSPDGQFDSGIEDPGGSFRVTFDQPGTYRYFCQIHAEQMTGTIVVTAGAAPTPRPTPSPTARPTTRPTATPTAGPTATPTAAPSAASATPLATPDAATTPPEASPPPTSSPASSDGPSPAPTTDASASPEPTAGPGDADAAGGIGPGAIVAGLLVVVLLVTGGLVVARRAGRLR